MAGNPAEGAIETMSVDVENLVTFEAPTSEAVARVELARPVLRFDGNPILTSHDVNRVWEPPALKVKTVRRRRPRAADSTTWRALRQPHARP